MARKRIGNISGRRYRGIVARAIEHTLEIGPWTVGRTGWYCYWCGNDQPDHETDCVWPELQKAFGQEGEK